ncbi:MAG: AraC family transcriptional regulator ligand-binding domain-containing protein [Bacteroidetes bacterium]|nr:AraC family transcriptional regulator ligand-binding domain-containing protein [Bacteroidota bacterium]
MPIIREIIYGVAHYGADPGELCQRSGIRLDDLNDSEARLEFESAARVWDYAVDLTGNKLLGLLLGERSTPLILGMIGHLMQSSPSLLEAFKAVSKFGEVATDMFRYDMKVAGTRCMLEYQPAAIWTKLYPESARHATEQAMSGTLHVFQLLGGKNIYPLKAEFSHQRKQPLQEYERVFGCPLTFGTKANQLLFEKHQLDQKVLSHDRSIYLRFERILQDLQSSMRKEKKLPELVEQIILSEFKGQTPPIAVMASRLNMTVRSFQRKLSEEGVVYRDFSFRIRMTIADKLLKNDQQSIRHVARVLGYSEASAFTRARKSWKSAKGLMNHS